MAPRSATKEKKKPAKKKSKKPKRVKYTARTADRYELYQLAVQSADVDVDFLVKAYKGIRKKHPYHLREDFCGTALLAAEWIGRGEKYTAEGYDIDAEPIEWGLRHNFEKLGAAASRCTLHVADARGPSDRAPDVRCAQNFSYCLFKTRAEMLAYFKGVYADLHEEGVFVLDMHGGPEAMEEMEEVRKIPEGFSYVWDQAEYWPATGDYRCHIHFRFKDGTELEKAFSYDWRLWTMPEIVDVLQDAGFPQVETYWEGTDKDGESGDGNFKKKKRGENCLSWIAYIVAAK